MGFMVLLSLSILEISDNSTSLVSPRKRVTRCLHELCNDHHASLSLSYKAAYGRQTTRVNHRRFTIRQLLLTKNSNADRQDGHIINIMILNFKLTEAKN